MKRSKQIAWVVAIGGVVALVVAVLWPVEPEPEYQGKKLSEWKELYKAWLYSDAPDERELAKSREAVKAAHEMRDSIVPIALKDIQYETPEWPGRVAERIVGTDLARWCPDSIWKLLNKDRGEDGLIYFRMLGPDASAAVPDLVRIMKNTKSPQTRKRVVYALGQVGEDGLQPLMEALANPEFPERATAVYTIRIANRNGAVVNPAVPLLVKNLTDSDQNVASAATWVLGRLALEPDVVVPALTNCMQNTNKDRRKEAITALGGFGNKARTAIPALKKALTDPEEWVRESATNALEKIAPEVLAKDGL